MGDGDLSGDDIPSVVESPPAEMPPAAPPQGPPDPPAPTAPGPAAPVAPVASVDNAAHLTLVVPADAELRFNGVPMRATGGLREFVSPPLIPGLDYTYLINARWFEGGRAIARTRKVQVRANLRLEVDLTQTRPGDVTKGP
jgi:uncharacterized protein (TIGR03000 family)